MRNVTRITLAKGIDRLTGFRLILRSLKIINYLNQGGIRVIENVRLRACVYVHFSHIFHGSQTWREESYCAATD